MRSSIDTQSHASVPPAPACSVRNALQRSIGPFRRERVRSSPNAVSAPSRSGATSASAASRASPSGSARASSSIASASAKPADTSSNGRSTAFAALVFAIVSCAAFWSFQKSGEAANASSSSTVLRLPSTSKIASHFGQSFAQLGEPRLDLFKG